MTGALDPHHSGPCCPASSAASQRHSSLTVVAAGLAMARPLGTLHACARLAPPAASPAITTATRLTSQPSLHTGVATFHRGGTRLGTGKHSDSGYGGRAHHSHPLRAISNSETNSSASASDDDDNDPPPAGCSRIKVELKKPLGIAFEEDKLGRMMVGEVIQGGNADKSGVVDAGDQLIATSAIVYGSEEDYQGVMVRKGMQKVRLNVRGERFETVIAAIGTHPYYVKVEMEFQKCKPALQDSLNGSTRS